MADSSARTQITIAIIGLVGVLATGIFSNLDKISEYMHPKPTPTPPVQPTPAVVKNIKVSSAAGTEGPKTLGEGPEQFMIVEASPFPGHLTKGETTQFTVTARYRLTSVEQATLIVGIVEYPKSSNCDGQGHTPSTSRAAITRGEHTVTVPIQWGTSKTVATKGSIGFEANFWSDVASAQLLKDFGAIPGYCYSFD